MLGDHVKGKAKQTTITTNEAVKLPAVVTSNLRLLNKRIVDFEQVNNGLEPWAKDLKPQMLRLRESCPPQTVEDTTTIAVTTSSPSEPSVIERVKWLMTWLDMRNLQLNELVKQLQKNNAILQLRMTRSERTLNKVKTAWLSDDGSALEHHKALKVRIRKLERQLRSKIRENMEFCLKIEELSKLKDRCNQQLLQYEKQLSEKDNMLNESAQLLYDLDATQTHGISAVSCFPTRK
ncbi:unnamed protein product [Soboliphyme baturini]|uniref:Uncharacterized protein n=1 Tax=Soboliphyme baturini TaxID=241478 RepID=A0A183JB12_9BILA|nr:unnamed protein product [Soboliphyme baturini]